MRASCVGLLRRGINWAVKQNTGGRRTVFIGNVAAPSISSGPCLMMTYKACIMKVFIMLKIYSKLSCSTAAEKCNQVRGPRRRRRRVLASIL